MSIEIALGKKVSKIELLEKENSRFKFKIDDKEFLVDAVKLEPGVYSIIYNDKSYNIELHTEADKKKYVVNALYDSFNLEIVDAQRRYRKSRQSGDEENEKVISSPMPGKVVKFLVKTGDKVKAGDTLVIVSAMKMENEFKASVDSVVKEVCAKEGDTVDGRQKLIVLE